MGIKCPKCQHENPDDLSFCGKCATRLPRPEGIEVTETLETPKEEITAGSTFAERYQIIEELGKGGMGRVYKAYDTKIKEKIALKLIRPEIAKDKKTIERFSNELRLARKVRHKNICGMFDLGEEIGTHFITMEYIPGEDLRSLVRRIGQLPIRKSISIAKQICEGLDEAHRLGVVHRDLKSNNIMIDKEGNVRIMDFGIARSLEANGITGAGVMIGTPEYMSPEQVEGKEVDQRSDIYSLGVILYEMLTGRVPFKGETALSIAMKHKSEAPQNPRWLNDQIPDRLSRLVLMCLEKNRERRYESAQFLLSALKNIDEKKIHIDHKEEKKASIAVLPFTNMSADSEQEYFCDGMTEEIINSLTHIKDLRVIARTSSFAFKGKKEDIREIGQKLDVETLLEGSVRKSGNRLRIMAQLINVTDGSHLWAERYDRDMEDIFDIQDEISLAIVDKLKVKLFGREKDSMAKRYTDDIEAYNLYLKGIHSLRLMTAHGMEESIECFQQALQKDPNYALAYDGLASVEIISAMFSNVPPQNAYPRAREYAQKALEIDKALGEAHATLGFIHAFYDWNWREAEKEFKQALELSPNNAENHMVYSNFLTISQRHEVAIVEANRAQELDPLSSYINAERGSAILCTGQFDRAIEELSKALKIDPDYYFIYFWLGCCYAGKSKFEEAIKEFEKAVELSGGIHWMVMALAITYHKMGKEDEAEKLFESLKKRSRDEYVPPICFFFIHLVQDEKDEAFEWLERACKEHDSFLLYMRVFPVDSFRIPDEPTYQNLLKKYGLD